MVATPNTHFHVERRRRDASSPNLPGVAVAPHLRRESDLVRARLQRWIELADSALGRLKRRSGAGTHSTNGKSAAGNSAR